MSQDTPSERDEIEMLLPWFVTGRLDATDKARVETFLARNPTMRRQIDLIRDEQSADISDNEAIRAPRTLNVERGMAAVAASTSLGTRQATAGLLGRIREFFDMPTPGRVRMATAAALTLLLLQTAAIGSLLWRDSSYVTASGGATAGSTAIVKFVDGASAQAVARALGDLNMTIVDGPKPGGTFVIRMSAQTLSKSDRDARIEALRKASGVIALVLP